MIKDKGDKVGGNRNTIKEEIPDNDAGHVSRAGAPGNGGPSGGSGGLKEADEAPRVKLERGDENELPTADIKTEMDGLIDSEGDPTKSPTCDMVGPGSLKSERLSSDSNDILDPQTGLRGPPMPTQESCQRGSGTGSVGDGLSCRAPDGVQPLPSNVISKQPSNMEVQYSQQQSQIFVFSTMLANKGAEAVLQGHFPSIIAYHCAQPGTKKYLEKHPLKMGQFNKQNPAQWLNNLAMVKNRGAIRGSGGPNMPPNMMSGPNCGPNQMGPMMGSGHMGNMHMGPNMGQMGPNMGHMGSNMSQMGPARMAGPGQPNQMMMMKGNGNQMPNMGPGGMGPGMSPMDGFPGNNGPCGVLDGIGGEGDLPWDTKNPMHPNGIGNVGNGNPGPGGIGPGNDGMPQGGPPSVSSSQECSGNRGGGSPADLLKLPLQGVKIPDENLTPQQRAHREEQLATIRKMQQMLFPESGMGPGGPNQGQLMDPSQNPNEQSPIGNNNMPPNSSAGGPGMNPNNVPMGFNQMGPMGPNCSMGPGNMGPMGSSGPMGPNGPNCSMGPNGPMGHNNPMGNMGGNMGPNVSMGPNGSMSSMGPNGPLGPGGMMGPNGPMGGGMPMSNMGPCMKGGMRSNACPDMKQSMCSDVHLNRPCSGQMGRMNPMGGMKPCMMGGPRIMPGANINAMNGGIMMDGGGMGECGNVGGPGDHHMGLGGPMCEEFSRNRNMSGSGSSNDSHKLGLRSPRSPSGADLDWQKLHHQFFDHDHKSNMDGELGGQVKSPCSDRGGMSTGSCLPPPPYGTSPLHRSASVPIATQSPSQCSNIQMPMSAEASRASSALNSPAECGATRASTGPSTGGPGPGQHKGLPKNPLDGGPEEGMFVRSLQCLAAQQQKQQAGPVKEANLMPVPSPQQIQYLNTFEGQELTIQKQPNTSIKEGANSNQKSPGMMPGTPEGHGNTGGGGSAPLLERSGRYSLDHSPGFPGSNNPQTPNSNITPNDKQRPSPSSNRSVQDSNCKTPVRDSMGPNTPSQSLSQGPYAPNSNQSTNPSMTSPSHVMMSNSNSMNNNPNSLSNNPNNLSNNSSNIGNNPNTLSTPNNLNNPSSISNPNTLNNPSGVNPGPNSNFNNKGGPNVVSASSSANSTNVNTPGSISNVNSMSNNPAGMGMGPKMQGGLDDSPTGMSGPPGNMPGGPENNGMVRNEHTPLVPGTGGGGGFDPISSLAQMSQQLTGGPPHPHAHPHSHHHAALLMQDMGCHMEGMGSGMNPMDNMMGPNDFPPEMNMSPKMQGGPMGPMSSLGPDPSMMGPRMSGKMAPFNGANIQVKASAPNTIQYLPTRPQIPCSAGPRGPPSLDFLHRVANPMHMDASKPSGMNMQYFPGGPCGGPMGHSGSPGMGPRMDMSDQMGPMGPMRQQGPMMGGPMRGGPGMLRMPHYPGGFNSPPKMADSFSPGMGPNPGMMCNPNFRPAMMKGAPMRMGAPNPSQPLPASMGGPGSFKSSQNFVVPSTADPNYAQQFHNFQQQLYATGTRSQAQPGPHYPGYMPK